MSRMALLAERILFGRQHPEEFSGLSRGEILALAQADCTLCLGIGLMPGRSGKERPCRCVWRAVWRQCFGRFRSIIEGEISSGYVPSRTTHAYRKGTDCTRQVRTFSPRIRINEEYCADFWLLAKRTLRDNPLGWQIFRFHFLLGAEAPLCCRKLGLDRGTFFHEVYRIEEKLGRAFAETEPYGIYPLDEYFGGTIRGRKTTSTGDRPAERTEGRVGTPLRAPLQTKPAAA